MTLRTRPGKTDRVGRVFRQMERVEAVRGSFDGRVSQAKDRIVKHRGQRRMDFQDC